MLKWAVGPHQRNKSPGSCLRLRQLQDSTNTPKEKPSLQIEYSPCPTTSLLALRRRLADAFINQRPSSPVSPIARDLECLKLSEGNTFILKKLTPPPPPQTHDLTDPRFLSLYSTMDGSPRLDLEALRKDALRRTRTYSDEEGPPEKILPVGEPLPTPQPRPRRSQSADRTSRDSPDSEHFTLRRRGGIRRRTRPRNQRPRESLLTLPKGIPSPPDAWNIHETAVAEPAESPMTLVEKRCRSRRCLLFVSPGDSTRCSRPAPWRRSAAPLKRQAGELNLRIHESDGTLTVHVVSGRNLCATTKMSSVYVKVALVPGGQNCRTALRRSCTTPLFDQKLSFRVRDEDLKRSVLVTAWRRDMLLKVADVLLQKQGNFWNHFAIPAKVALGQESCQYCTTTLDTQPRDPDSRSEFLGCMSFAVKHAVRKEASGTFRLVSGRTSKSSMMGSVTEEVLSITSDVESPIPLPPMERRKSCQKKKAEKPLVTTDDSSFLRYLELEPADSVSSGAGRTPFTTTRRLTRKGGAGFGFSVAWTQPPRIERVEAGLSADRAGLRPGDYIIFVDKHNVVTMPEEEILSLIRSCGSALTLEVYRRPTPNGLVPAPSTAPPRPPTVCSGATSASLDFSRRRLQLPQVTFSSETEPLSREDARRRAVYQLLSKEQHYALSLQFGVSRFLLPLSERKDLLSSNEHQTLFQNSEELLLITEDILEQMLHEDVEPLGQGIGKVYLRKMPMLTNSYRKYLSGLKAADCLLVAKTRNTEFMRLLVEPAVPRRRPDLTAFLHKPLEHYRDILKLLQTIMHYTKVIDEDYSAISKVVQELQTAYRDVAVGAGLMEPEGEGRPLLSLQDLESRVVFTRCKPFVLSAPGRQWIFGGDLARVEGRTARPFWALLFSDLLLLATVSRDRVLFVTEEPLPLLAVSQACFNIRKKVTEFRLLLDGNSEGASSPTTGGCGPELSRHQKKSSRKRTVVLRAPTPELKAVWQNLIQRQIIYLNTTRGSTPASSPLDSPDPPTTLSVATLDSLSLRRQTPLPEVRSPESSRKQLDELIELRCRRLGKAGASKGSALHLAQWMRGQLGGSSGPLTPEDEPEPEVWSPETLRRRSEQLQPVGTVGRNESRCEEIELSDTEHSHSRSTSDSQVTVRSGGPEQTVPVCRQCHKTCLANSPQSPPDLDDDTDCDDNWGPLMLMGMSALSATVGLGPAIVADPFSPTEVPMISILPPTPDTIPHSSNFQWDDVDMGRAEGNPHRLQSQKDDTLKTVEEEEEITRGISLHGDIDPPYKSLSSNGLKRFGTMASLEMVEGDDDNAAEDATDSEEGEDWDTDPEDQKKEPVVEETSQPQLEVVTQSIRGWTARAGSFVAEKMALFERLGEESRAAALLDRYLRPALEEQVSPVESPPAEHTSSGDECETSGDDVWGTPTSGGDLEEDSAFPTATSNRDSPVESGSSAGAAEEDTELMMEELLAAPPLATNTRTFPTRRRLEPLPEEEDTYTPSDTPSPEQGNVSGGVADSCHSADNGSSPSTRRSFFHRLRLRKVRDDSYRAKTNKLVCFLSGRKTDEVGASVGSRPLFRLFTRESTDHIPTTLPRQLVTRRQNDKQLERRFWKQLSKRRSTVVSSPAQIVA